MATAENTILDATPAVELPRFLGLPQTPGVRTALLSAGAALILAIMVGIWLWSQQPDYRVLFSNFNDKDGGSIVASLQQMNVPYKYSDSGTAILVPASQVHDARLKLATQGLPKGGNVGFELMENQKLGVSQFLEQVNFQRALEGELAKTIQSVASVQAARVHLAIPKPNVFVRDQQNPTASVLLNLYPGRILDQAQVNAILHLVASSVPELSTKNVSIVDQNGNLLSDTNKQSGSNNLDPSQIKYVQDFQDNVVKRVESIITPIVGKIMYAQKQQQTLTSPEASRQLKAIVRTLRPKHQRYAVNKRAKATIKTIIRLASQVRCPINPLLQRPLLL